MNDLRSRVVLQTDGRLEDRPRRRDRRAARRRGDWLLDRAADHARLHHDAQVPPEHLPGRRRDAGSGAAQEVRRQARARRELSVHGRRGSAADHGGARLPHVRRHDRPRRRAPSRRTAHRPLEGRRPRPVAAARAGREAARRRRGRTARAQAGPRPRTSRSTIELDRPRRSSRSSSGKKVAHELDDREYQPHGRHDAEPRDRRRSGARTRCRTTRSTSSSRAAPARASARSSPRASRSSSKATATTTSAKACRAAGSSSIRRARARSRPRTTC